MRPRTRVLAIAGAAALLGAAALCGPDRTTPPAAEPEPAVSASAEAYRRRAEHLEARATVQDGTIARLQAALRARSEVRPRQVVRYDTIIQPETVTIALSIDRRGQLEQIRGTPPDGTTAPKMNGYTPERITADLSACDDGISIAGGRVVCDRPRLGHLYLVATGGAALPWQNALGNPIPAVRPQLELATRWVPSYRSLWSIELRVDSEGIAAVGVRRALQLF